MSNAGARPASPVAGLVHIQNISHVEIVRGSTDTALCSLSLIDSENARDKSTLRDMARSMTSGDPRT